MKSENKKVKNATELVIDNIKFKSKLEASVYKHLVEEGFVPGYELEKYVLWEGIKPTIPFYGKKGLDDKKLIDITYTPDFTFSYKDKFIIIEVKGMQNDVFPYKFKMFRKLLESYVNKDDILIFEVFSIKQLKECIKIIRNEGDEGT